MPYTHPAWALLELTSSFKSIPAPKPSCHPHTSVLRLAQCPLGPPASRSLLSGFSFYFDNSLLGLHLLHLPASSVCFSRPSSIPFHGALCPAGPPVQLHPWADGLLASGFWLGLANGGVRDQSREERAWGTYSPGFLSVGPHSFPQRTLPGPRGLRVPGNAPAPHPSALGVGTVLTHTSSGPCTILCGFSEPCPLPMESLQETPLHHSTPL